MNDDDLQAILDHDALVEHGKRIAALETELDRFREMLRHLIGPRIAQVEVELENLKVSIAALLEP